VLKLSQYMQALSRGQWMRRLCIIQRCAKHLADAVAVHQCHALAYSPLGHLGHAPPLAPAAEKSATKQRQ